MILPVMGANMAVSYGAWQAPTPHNMNVNLVDRFAQGYGFGKNVKDEQTAPDAFGKYLDALTGKPQATGLDALVGSSHQATAAAQDPTLTAYFNNIKAAESGGDPNAKNPRSSATGLYQFTEGTWADVAKNNPQLGLTPDGRTDPAQQERAVRAFTGQNAKTLSQSGVPVNPGNLYAAHFLGAGGASKVLPMPDDTPMAAAVSPEVIQANPFMQNMTVGEFKQWSAQKGGGQNGGYQPPRQQQAQAQGGLPDRETMMALFKNPNTRPLAIELARSAQAGTAPSPVEINGQLVDPSTGKVIGDYRDAPTGPKPTSGIQEYEYAKSQGYQGSFQEFQVEQKKAGASNVTMNANQGAAAAYADRMSNANKILSNPKLTEAQVSIEQTGKSGVPVIGNFLTSSERQQAEQAQRDFVNALLRRESGAVIADSEFESAAKQYFPQPGDTPEVIEQKARNRETALNGVARAAGASYQPPSIAPAGDIVDWNDL